MKFFFRCSFKIIRLRSLSYDASQCKGNDVTVLWLQVSQWSVMVDKPSVHFFLLPSSLAILFSLNVGPSFAGDCP